MSKPWKLSKKKPLPRRAEVSEVEQTVATLPDEKMASVFLYALLRNYVSSKKLTYSTELQLINRTMELLSENVKRHGAESVLERVQIMLSQLASSMAMGGNASECLSLDAIITSLGYVKPTDRKDGNRVVRTSQSDGAPTDTPIRRSGVLKWRTGNDVSPRANPAKRRS